MSSTLFYEKELYTPKYEDGKSDTTKKSYTIELSVSNYFGDSEQIYLKFINNKGEETILHLSKKEASNLSESLENAVDSIGYNNA
jgi:hypothetical protein